MNMLAFINFLLCLALSLVGFVAGGPFPDSVSDTTLANGDPWDHFVWQNNGKALSETWVGRQAVNVGDVTGDGLYTIAKDYIWRSCGGKWGWCDEVSSWQTVYTHQIKNFPDIQDSYFQMNVAAKWSSDEIREQMFEQMARTMQQLTNTAENCYTVPGHNVMCNIGDFIYINYPDVDGHRNYVRMKLYGPWVHETFKCCKSLNKVDEASDSLKDKIGHAFGRDYSRDNKCLIWLDKTCGECGGKCDSCGSKCPDDCPKGNC